jgi:hypothetical protein
MPLPGPDAERSEVLEVVRGLDSAGVAARDVARREATLDDVFLTLTAKPQPREEVAA